MAQRTFFRGGFGGCFIAAARAFPFYRFRAFIKGGIFQLLVQVKKEFFVAGFNLNNVFKKPRDIIESFLFRGFNKFGIDFFRLVFFVFRGKCKVIEEIPFLFEREARGNIDVFDDVFVGGLQE